MNKRVSFLNQDWIKARLYHLLAPLVMLLLVWIFAPTWLGQFIEYQTVKLRFQLRADLGLERQADPRIVFVAIDQKSLDALGRYPWPRTTISTFLNAIALNGLNPYSVVFDILYTDPSGNPDDDKQLGAAAANLAGVITGSHAEDPISDATTVQREEDSTINQLKNPGPTQPLDPKHINGDVSQLHDFKIAILPVDPLRTQSLFGFVNDDPSPIDDIRHSIKLILRVNGQVYPSLSLQALCQTLGVDMGKVEVNLGRNILLPDLSGKIWTIPIDDQGEYTINYHRKSTFTTIPFSALAAALVKGIDKTNPAPLPPGYNVDKKILLVGEAAVGLVDMGPTPVEAQSFLPFVHLNVINNVLQNDYLHFVPLPWVVIGWLVVTWATLMRLKSAPLIEAVLSPILAIVAFIVIAFVIFIFWSIQVVLAWPVLGYGGVAFGGVVLRWREEQQGRQQLKQIFSKMLPSGLVNHLLDHPENLNLGGSLRPVTILFSDIRDFTKISENIDTQELVRQLNVYFERMVACVEECRGTLHKFIGDAVMAAWGDLPALSLGVEQDARNAVRSALLMRRRLAQLNDERTAAGEIPIRIGIGLNHGDVAAAQMGASIRSEFTVIGDPVNVASRLEGMTKEFHTDIAISETVRQLVGDDFIVRRLGLIVLKGKTKPTVVFEVLAETSHPEDSRLPVTLIAKYEEAFDHFLARRFSQAKAGFQDCEKECPDDYCVQNYLDASRKFAKKAPPADWDGRIVMKTK